MQEDRFLRQQDAVNMSRLTQLGISIIGAGAIGSTTAVFLGKMGACALQVWDADFVESHNFSNQLYRDQDIGKPKAAAFVEVMEQFGGHTPNAIASLYSDQPLTEVAISAVDSMHSRKDIWKSVREKANVRLLIDARMGLETLGFISCGCRSSKIALITRQRCIRMPIAYRNPEQRDPFVIHR